MLMAKKEFDEIHEKIDKILELTNSTNIRLSVVETKLNYTSSAVDEQKESLKNFVAETVCQRKECAAKFKEIDNTLNKGQGAILMVGFVGAIFGLIVGIWSFVSGFFK